MHFPKTKLFSVIFHLLIQKCQVDAQEKGQPALSDCWTPEYAKKMSPRTPTKQLINLVPTWSNKEHPQQWVWVNYNWKYRMVQVNGKEVPIEIKQHWLTYDNDAVLTIQSYELTPGHYKVNATAKPKNQPDLPHFAGECHIIYEALKPIVIVSGGSSRLVPAHTDLTISAEDSSDPNTLKASSEGFQFYWTCKQKTPSQFCDKSPLSTTSKLTIPANFLVDGEKFEVTVNITTPKHNPQSYTNWATFTQTVEVSIDAALLEVSCRKNCPPATDYSSTHSITFLTVECLKRCESIKDDDYEWTLEKYGSENFQFDYEKNTQFGRNNYRFIIVKDVLDPGIYTVSLGLKTTVPLKGGSSKSLEIPRLPTVKNCKINPSKGDTYTMFGASCSPEKDTERNFYEIYAKNKKDSTTILVADEYFPKVKNLSFMLPQSKEFEYYVKITTPKRASKEYPVSATVNSLINKEKPNDEILKELKKMYEGETPDKSLSKLMLSTDPKVRQNGFQKFRALVNEVFDVKDGSDDFQKFVEELKYRAIDDLLKVPFRSLREIMKVGDTVTRLLTYNEANKSDPLLAKFSSSFCKKMSEKHVEAIKNESFPLAAGDLSRKVADTLVKCLGANTNPNFDIMKPFPINITTEVPVLLEPVIEENYPDYQYFDDEHYKNMENLLEATLNVFEGTAALAKALALTAAIGEEPLLQNNTASETLVAKDKAISLAKMKLRLKGVVLEPPRISSEHSLDIFLTTWFKDIFWWNPNHTKTATNIIHIQFWHSTCKERIRHFEEPANIYLNVNRQSFKLEIVEDLIPIPEGYLSMFHQDLNRHIYVRRVALPYQRSLVVKFHNLSTTLNVVVVHSKFPTIEDFAPPKIIGANNSNYLVFPNLKEFDIWVYIGILPIKNAIKDKSVKSVELKMSFVASCCIRWQPVKYQWRAACMPGNENNATIIHCQCKNFSTIAGHTQNIKSIVQKMVATDFVIELQANLLIFITVALIITLYCLLLLFTLCKRKKKSILYFLADNLPKHRYAYLVIVTTGKKGTTSNVTIQIKGNQKSTPAHVLNYPDPKLRILQKKSKDVFVVTNEEHLGEIVEIDLWFDCNGARPSWYCEEIEIYDLQSKKSWYFNVGRLFSAEKGKVAVTLAPSERVHKILKKISIWNDFHTWCFWSHERSFSYVKRLTVVLSSTLTMAMIILMMRKVPEMELRDSFDLDHYIFKRSLVLEGFLGSLVAFGIHMSIAWCFRLSMSESLEFEEEKKFPYSVTKGCWRILVGLIVTSSTFLVVCGFWVPFNRSLQWLTACGIGLGFQLFVYENIFLAVFSIFKKYKTVEYVEDKLEAIIAVIHKQRLYLYQSFGDYLLQPFVEHLHKPVPPKQIKKQKMEDAIRQQYSEELIDLIMFTIYNIILYVVILINKDSLTHINQKEMLSMFEGQHTRTIAFTAVRNVDEMYQYINQTLIPVMQPVHWYQGLPISDPGAMVDFVNKFIGVARLRQNRISSDFCYIHKMMTFVNVTECWPEFTSSEEEKKIFGYNWGSFSSILMLDRLRSIWQFVGEGETKTLTFTGKMASYSGGGYVAYLGRKLRNSYVNFHKIANKLWIDQQTRSFFIEFLTYNANLNMFNAVRLLFEQSGAGFIIHTTQIYSARMIFIQNEMEKMSLAFSGLFILWVLVLLFKRSVTLIKDFRHVYKDFWMVVDLIIITLSLSCIGLYAIRFKMVRDYLDSLERVKHNEFISYFSLFYIEDFIAICAGFLILISTARLWKFLRFGLFFRIMERTLSAATFPLFAATLAFFVVLTAFGLSGVLIFGNEFPELSSLLKVVSTLIILSLKPDQFSITSFIRYNFAYWYFASYLLLMQIMLFLYVTIIIMSYVKAQLDFSVEPHPYNMQTFVHEQAQNIPKYFQRKYERLRGGDEKKLVKPKSDEFRYANCMSTELSTLRVMKCVAKCMIRNLRMKDVKSLSDRDVRLMEELCHNMVFKGDDQTEIFFKGHFEGERIRIIDEKRIMKVAEVVELLLRPPEKVSKELRKKQKGDVKEECVKIIKTCQNTLKRCDLKLKLIYYGVKDFDFDDF